MPTDPLLSPAAVPKTRGFSLIEILVVLLIIGIASSFALVSFGDFAKKRQIITDAEDFVDYVQLVKQQAILENRHFLLRWHDHEYEVLRYQAKDRWQSMHNSGFFRSRHIHAAIKLHFGTQYTQQSANIMIYASGQMTPFVLHFEGPDHTDIAMVKGYADGKLLLQRDSP